MRIALKKEEYIFVWDTELNRIVVYKPKQKITQFEIEAGSSYEQVQKAIKLFNDNLKKLQRGVGHDHHRVL